jgi:hypothetical protein
MLLIDPYVYSHLSIKDINVMNRVADNITNNFESLDIEILVSTILEIYKSGMDARALEIHIRRELKL